ncbi:MAG: phosphoglycerate kinase [Nitrospinae bacterium]|nr:phosphoglycerate kinase [Nitrospinota bacterium]
MNLLENLTAEDLLNKTIFIRVDFNVPLQSKSAGRFFVEGDERIRRFLDKSFQKIHELTHGNCRIIIGSHLGRPHKFRDHAQWDGIFNLQFVCSHFETLLKRRYEDSYIVFPPESMDSQLSDSIEIIKKKQLPLGGIKFLPNLRYLFERESDYREKFMEDLADICDVYINCAFGTSHRESRSIIALPRLMKKNGKLYVAGVLLAEEVSRLGELASRMLENPGKSAFLAGGSKVSDKIGLIKQFAVSGISRILLGGKMVNSFLLARDFKINGAGDLPLKLKPKEADEKSFLDEIRLAGEILEAAKDKGVEIFFPVDYKVAPAFDSKEFSISGSPDFNKELQLDLGPKTIKMYSEILQEESVKNIFWNGPMGAFDHPANKGYAEGSVEITKCLLKKCLWDRDALSVIGGGDSAAVVQKLDLAGIRIWLAHELSKMIPMNVNHDLFEIKFPDRDLYTFMNYLTGNFFTSTGGGASLEFLEAYLKDNGSQPYSFYLPGTRVLEE